MQLIDVLFGVSPASNPRYPERRAWAEGHEMINLRVAVPAVLVAAVLAGWVTYFFAPLPQIETDKPLPQPQQTLVPDPSTPTQLNQRPSAEEQAAADFQQAAAAILKKAPDTQASADFNAPPITGHIPLPKRRPIPR